MSKSLNEITPHAAHLKAEIRRKVRHERNKLTNQFQQNASTALIKQLLNLPHIQSAKTLALYLPNDGELDPSPFIKWCWQHNKQVVLPIIHPFNRQYLLFIRFHANSKLKPNRYGIPEPILDVGEIVPVSCIDIVFTPLVAFDNQGQRLGMGGGFYDRTLAFTHQGKNTASSRPSIIGLAHDCQEIEQVPSEVWDIPLPEIITPTRIIRSSK